MLYVYSYTCCTRPLGGTSILAQSYVANRRSVHSLGQRLSKQETFLGSWIKACILRRRCLLLPHIFWELIFISHNPLWLCVCMYVCVCVMFVLVFVGSWLRAHLCVNCFEFGSQLQLVWLVCCLLLYVVVAVVALFFFFFPENSILFCYFRCFYYCCATAGAAAAAAAAASVVDVVFVVVVPVLCFVLRLWIG